ncbi:hypothetical protein DPMN_023326 [Dreissena polymorpha]|uniref:Uncharacterized protein n=1 Tax=Dreissena polymorpha TaxID=45954 RepID=A0A9D4LPG2_DREPO|nr:hypothetical protein DPMN_023326 [Dreissena polymorpha]
MARKRPTRIPTPHDLPRGAPGLVMGPCIFEIDRIAIREVQYQFEDNRCRNEEIILPCVVGEDSGQDGRTEYHNNHNIPTFSPKKMTRNGAAEAARFVRGPCIVVIDRIVIRDVQYPLQENRYSGKDGRTDRRTAEITTISSRFSKKLLNLRSWMMYPTVYSNGIF